MAAVANGIAVGGFFRVFCSTYLVFSDYMRPSIRLAAMMRLPVIYVFTHDSVFLGEDGPTHQPVEQLASLRAIPGLSVLRPGDAEETCVAWKMAISMNAGPTALILSRQPLKVYEKDDAHWEENLKFGAYIVSDSVGDTQDGNYRLGIRSQSRPGDQGLPGRRRRQGSVRDVQRALSQGAADHPGKDRSRRGEANSNRSGDFTGLGRHCRGFGPDLFHRELRQISPDKRSERGIWLCSPGHQRQGEAAAAH